MLYSEIIAVCSQIHTKHKYTVWAERTAKKTLALTWIVFNARYVMT
jgi:hypothetical protein